MRFLSLLAIAIVFWTGCEPTTESAVEKHKFDDAVLVSIYTFQDERQTDSLLPYLVHENPLYREEAAMAFGSVQDSLAIPALVKALADSSAAVQVAAAYALGQTRDSTAAPALIGLLKAANPAVSGAAHEALGKVGNETDLATLLEQGTHGESFFRALYYFGLQGISSKEAEELAAQHLIDDDPAAALYAGAYLGRLKKMDSSVVRSMVPNWEKVSNPEAASHAVRVFRHQPEPEINALLGKIIADPKTDYRTRVNAVRSLHFLEGHSPWPSLKTALHAAEVQVQVAAGEKIVLQPDFFPFDSLAAQTRQADLHWRTAALLYTSAVKLHIQSSQTNYSDLEAELIDRFNGTTNIYEKGNLLMALGQDPANHQLAVEVMETSDTPALKSYAAMAISSLYQTSNPFSVEDRIEVLKKGILTGDVAVMAVAVSELMRKDADYKAALEDLTFLDEGLASLTLPRDIEIYHLFERCRNYLADTPDRELAEVPFVNPIDWEQVRRIDTGAKMKVQTSKGEITWQLQVEQTPGTVANFVALAESGFFNGKTIHRVVPNFVAQGGCTRGDGWGSTPETIRSEWPLDHYQRGSVGVASAGKDTESCQFFITHCATPHLDGRYTIFARVVGGMEIADQLEMGDRIESVTLEGVSSQSEE